MNLVVLVDEQVHVITRHSVRYANGGPVMISLGRHPHEVHVGKNGHLQKIIGNGTGKHLLVEVLGIQPLLPLIDTDMNDVVEVHLIHNQAFLRNARTDHLLGRRVDVRISAEPLSLEHEDRVFLNHLPDRLSSLITKRNGIRLCLVQGNQVADGRIELKAVLLQLMDVISDPLRTAGNQRIPLNPEMERNIKPAGRINAVAANLQYRLLRIIIQPDSLQQLPGQRIMFFLLGRFILLPACAGSKTGGKQPYEYSFFHLPMQ